jgi:hypothetical protein
MAAPPLLPSVAATMAALAALKQDNPVAYWDLIQDDSGEMVGGQACLQIAWSCRGGGSSQERDRAWPAQPQRLVWQRKPASQLPLFCFFHLLETSVSHPAPALS